MNLTTTLTTIGSMLVFATAAQVAADGNRYDQPRYYLSEISVSEAYLEMEHSKGYNKGHHHDDKPVLIDVRSLREYASGHPEDAYNVPYPNLYGSGDQDALTMYWEVYDIVKGRMDTPLMLLCATGSRSVKMGNILAKPDSNPATVGLPPFTNVRNIWEGFVGQYKYAYTGDTVTVDPVPVRLDLNNDGVIGDNVADVYTESKDANPDKDGWRNFAALPWTTKIRRSLSYLEDPDLYEELNLTPVE